MRMRNKNCKLLFSQVSGTGMRKERPLVWGRRLLPVRGQLCYDGGVLSNPRRMIRTGTDSLPANDLGSDLCRVNLASHIGPLRPSISEIAASDCSVPLRITSLPFYVTGRIVRLRSKTLRR